MTIQLATIGDVQDILILLKANHADYIEDKSDGFVTTNITEEQLKALIIEENGVTVAKEDGKVIAFAFAASWDYWKVWPFFAHMIDILPQFSFAGQTLTTENSYQYGPVCVDKAFRGTGLFEQVFTSSLDSMSRRYPIMATFINQINPRSYAAHTRKAQMEQVGTFDFNDNHYYLMACSTNFRGK